MKLDKLTNYAFELKEKNNKSSCFILSILT